MQASSVDVLRCIDQLGLELIEANRMNGIAVCSRGAALQISWLVLGYKPALHDLVDVGLAHLRRKLCELLAILARFRFRTINGGFDEVDNILFMKDAISLAPFNVLGT
ncbi:hypothetical protein C1933_02020 [Stenotrophomonas sp. ZAC14D2_NAIMI4_6]|nr:hypothetical protein C1933_02020 [Stenotrophomonas sp. ZAC14D2_NAIMI4_6]